MNKINAGQHQSKISFATKHNMKAIAICSIALLAGVLAEPPVRNYLPPNAGGYPSGGGNGGYPSGGPSTGGPGGPSGPGGYPGGPPPPPSGAGGNGGSDDGSSEPANYEFSYEVKDAASGNDFGHSEMRQGDVTKGKYYVLLPDGRKQIVEYTADSDGYKPKITYEGEANTSGAPGGGSQGAGGYPSGGSSGYPSTPSGGYPSSPSGGYPSSPSGGYPSSPSGGYPSSQGGFTNQPSGNGNGNSGYRY